MIGPNIGPNTRREVCELLCTSADGHYAVCESNGGWACELSPLRSLLLSCSAYAANVEGWEVNYFPDNKAPSGCIMTGDFQDGSRLSVLVSKSYEWGLGFANAKWHLQKGASTMMAAYIDGKLVVSGKAEHFDTTLIVLPLVGKAVAELVADPEFHCDLTDVSHLCPCTVSPLVAILDRVAPYGCRRARGYSSLS